MVTNGYTFSEWKKCPSLPKISNNFLPGLSLYFVQTIGDSWAPFTCHETVIQRVDIQIPLQHVIHVLQNHVIPALLHVKIMCVHKIEVSKSAKHFY